MTRLSISLILLLSLGTCGLPCLAQEAEVNLASGEWGPYLGEKLPDGGLAARIVTAAFAEAGVKVRYGYFPWKRSYDYALQGRDNNGESWHGTVIWVRTDERAKDFLFSDPVISDDEVLFSLKAAPVRWETIGDLQDMSIGGTLHTVYPLFEKAEADGILRLYRASNYDMLFKRLLQKRIDAVPQVRRVGEYYLATTLREQDRARIMYWPTVIQTRQYRVMFSNRIEDNKRLLRLFNQGLARLRASGRYQEILDSEDYRQFRLEEP